MTYNLDENWIANDINSIPDFIIGGSMKSGTTTLHQILAGHPNVFIPEKEIRFFDTDNILQHPNFHSFNPKNQKWSDTIQGNELKKAWKWYQNLYEDQKTMLKGEDSTSYLASEIAADRISRQNKKIKLIFLLRQPTLRAYSQYYHMLRRDSAMWSFEDTLKFNPYSVLYRSLYKTQLEYYYSLFPEDQIKVILFEDLIKNPKCVIKDLSIFLNLDYAQFPDEIFDMHANKAKLPRFPRLQLHKNKIIGNLSPRYINKSQSKSKQLITEKVFEKFFNRINPKINKKAPRINPSTKEYLDKFFYRELNGIDELTGLNIMKRWFDK
ncbi:sulfotransferase family protein [Salegentibacter salegens]|uniref:Sulfotransferase family protein n=1 Tax=Salegentibacter salegens TaxID=143223 RepID=A0A1M7HBZ2_9FLAO|nr:sulfotransferase [Salegentibacter salegens]PRX43511.1 sulfotransferase family protein [Salegentibacter salegens]SHM26081.1 Sulfotransferase family protein [Salegentibacter salegens]